MGSGWIERCRDTLLPCSEFEDNIQLRSFFSLSEKLRLFKNRLPEANNILARVKLTIFFLVDQKLTDGRLVMSIFLDELSLQYEEGTELKQKLKSLSDEFNNANHKYIPIVIVAMTRQEAKNLFDRTVFKDDRIAPSERTAFNNFWGTLPRNVKPPEAWVEHYAENRDNWEPSVCSAQTNITPEPNQQKPSTIETIVFDEFIRHNKKTSDVSELISSDGFFSPDEQTRHDTWLDLRQRRYVMIIDAITLFHPRISEYILQSGLSANSNAVVSMLVLPLNLPSKVNKVIEGRLKRCLQIAFKSFYDDIDTHYKLNLDKEIDLRHWLATTLREFECRRERATRQNVENLRSQTSGPTGIESLVLSRG